MQKKRSSAPRNKQTVRSLELDFSVPAKLAPPSNTPRQLNFVKVANHPTGGFTLAIPINQEIGSGRTYHQWFSKESDAIQRCNEHNQDLCKRYKNNPEFILCIAAYKEARKAAKTTAK